MQTFYFRFRHRTYIPKYYIMYMSVLRLKFKCAFAFITSILMLFCKVVFVMTWIEQRHQQKNTCLELLYYMLYVNTVIVMPYRTKRMILFKMMYGKHYRCGSCFFYVKPLMFLCVIISLLPLAL